MTKTNTFTLLVLGGTSAIALAYARARLADPSLQGRATRVVLVGRNASKLDTERKHFEALGTVVDVRVADLSAPAKHSEVLAGPEPLDEVILAYGTLTDQDRAQTENQYLTEQLDTNFTSAALWLEQMAIRFKQQGHGTAIVIGSVAGDRGRQSNYVYGAAKAGLAAFTNGLQHRFAPQPDIHFLLVKPGFVDSPMTQHIQGKGALWATPEKVAAIILRAVHKKKLTIYTPWFWSLVMLAIRNTPAMIFHKTKL